MRRAGGEIFLRTPNPGLDGGSCRWKLSPRSKMGDHSVMFQARRQSSLPLFLSGCTRSFPVSLSRRGDAIVLNLYEGEEVLSMVTFLPPEVQAKVKPQTTDSAETPRTATPRAESPADLVQQSEPSPPSARSAHSAEGASGRAARPPQPRQSGAAGAVASSPADAKKLFATKVLKCFTSRDGIFAQGASIPLRVTLDAEGRLAGPAILTQTSNRRAIDTNLLRAAGSALERCEPYGADLGSRHFHVTFYANGRLGVSELTPVSR